MDLSLPDQQDKTGAVMAEGALDELDGKIQNCSVDTEVILSDAGYRKHLVKHSNKYVDVQSNINIQSNTVTSRNASITITINVLQSFRVLLRVRMLYYLQQEIISTAKLKALENVNWSQLDIQPVPKCEGEPPATWYVTP